MSTPCPECGSEYTNLGMHWYHSPEHRPKVPEYAHEVLTGLLLGDGHVNRGHDVPYIDINCISKQYLEYIDRELGWLTTGVRLYRDAEDQAHNCRESGFVDDPDPDDYHDIYTLKTRSHPDLQRYAMWYDSGEKVWPTDLVLTPTVLKHWYCGDGNKDSYGTTENIRISTANEASEDEKIRELFRRVNLPEPNIVVQEKDGYETASCRFTASESQTLWEYMGDPLPDFGYKWPEDYN